MDKIVCVNSSGQTATFAYELPLWLLETEGITEIQNEIQTTEETGEDGSSFEGMGAKERYITITAAIIKNHFAMKEHLYSVFGPEGLGTLYVYDGESVRQTEYRVESVFIPSKGVSRNCMITLHCADPLFYETHEERTIMAVWKKMLKIPFVYKPPFKVGEMVNSLIADIYNYSGKNMPIRIIFKASGEVKRPSLIYVNTQKELAVDIEMHNGDEIVITTGKDNKHILLVRDNQTEEITELAGWPIAWHQLEPGKNTFRYNAVSGMSSLSCEIWYRRSYQGG